MRSEETMPLRRGNCGDDCMPTTSVNQKKLKMGGRERNRTRASTPFYSVLTPGRTIFTYKCPANFNSSFSPPCSPSFQPSSSSPAFSTRSSSRQATTIAISSSSVFQNTKCLLTGPKYRTSSRTLSPTTCMPLTSHTSAPTTWSPSQSPRPFS